MDTPKKPRNVNKRVWPVAKSNKDISRTIANANDQANANIGDSYESRMGFNSYLGGGADPAGCGYNGEYLQQSVFSGEESLPRGNTKLGQKSRGETKRAWGKIAIVRNVYDNDGQVASIIDLMADFVTEGIQFIHEDKGAQNFYRAWSEKLKLRNKVRRVVIDLLISGTTFLYKVYAKLSESEKRAMRRLTVAQTIGNQLLITDTDDNEILIDPKIQYDSIMRQLLDPENTQTDAQFDKQVKELVVARIKSEGEKIIERPIKKGEKGVIPWKYISLNPLQMRPNPAGGWSYLLGKEDLINLADKASVRVDENKKSLRLTLPDGLAGTIKPIKNVEDAGGFFAQMDLTPERLTVIPWNKYDWAKWGTAGGLVWKAMPTITFKNSLRKMEQKTATTALNMVYLWKLGNVKEGIIPTLEDYERFADMLKAPSSTINILWNDAISGEVIQPKLDQIFDPARWEGLRAELTSQFGITQAIITGEGGNFSSSFISVQGLLERLQSVRDVLLEEWLLPEALTVKTAMGFQKMPKVAFNQMSLRDKNAENTFLMALYDRGIVSDETMYESLDKDVTVERSRIKEQEEHLAKEDMGRKGPFDANKDQLDFQKESKESDDKHRDKQFEEQKKQNVEKNKVDIEKAKNPPEPIGQPGGTGGKPGGKTGPQKKKRETKPKNVARLDVENMVKDHDAAAKLDICMEHGVSDYRKLTKAGKVMVDTEVLNRLAAQSSDQAAFRVLLHEARAELVTAENRQLTKAEFHRLLIDTYMEVQ